MSTALPEDERWPKADERQANIGYSCVYEQSIARSAGAKRAIAFGYARHALISVIDAARAIGLGAGDEVILSPLTCKVVPLALLSMKLKPVYADISAETLNLDPDLVEAAVGPATLAILFQHTYGHSAGVEAIAGIADRKHKFFVEDCAHCLPISESDYQPGKRAGLMGHASIFSNNLLKPVPAGCGGVAVTDNYRLAAEISERRDRMPYRGPVAEAVLWFERQLHRRLLRPKLYWPLFEINRYFSYRTRSIAAEINSEISDRAYRISERQGREGLNWLSAIRENAANRQSNCADYDKALQGIKDLKTPCAGASEPLYYFPALIKEKDDLLREARRRLIEIIPWPMRTPIYPVERESELLAYGYRPGSCPVAEETARCLIGLPTASKVDQRRRDALITLLRDHHENGGS